MLARWLATAAVALPVAIAGCGGDDDAADGDPPTTSAPATTVEEAPSTSTPERATAPAPEEPSAPEPAPAPAPDPPPEPLPGLPGYTAGFQSWDRLNSEPIPPDSANSQRAGFDAHLSTKNVRVDGDRQELAAEGRGTRRPYPDGTILVKEGRTGGFISLVAIMRKIQGVDPEHGDWEFVEYKRSGPNEAFETEPRLMGQLCWQCHTIARDTDWVFTPNDAG